MFTKELNGFESLMFVRLGIIAWVWYCKFWKNVSVLKNQKRNCWFNQFEETRRVFNEKSFFAEGKTAIVLLWNARTLYILLVR